MNTPASTPSTRRTWPALLACCASLWGTAVQAQFAMVPAPLIQGAPRESVAEVEQEYRIDAARHIYAAYPMRVYRGKLPPLLYGAMMVETEIDATGQIVNVSVIRKPAADEVAPWVLAMIRRAAPYPAPTKLAQPGATTKFLETWFVDRSGLFQVMSLTEGQR
jgi:periplasmic protein TonB